MKILVSAASRYGSTTEIAKAIADDLTSQGFTVLCAAPEDIDTLEGVEAVVLGSAVYVGHWLPPAVQLAERVGRELSGRPVWLFSSGPVGDPSRKLAHKMATDPVELPALRTRTKPRGHQLFAGKLDRHHLHFLQRAALTLVRGLDGDFRDWQSIHDWSNEIGEQLREQPEAPIRGSEEEPRPEPTEEHRIA